MDNPGNQETSGNVDPTGDVGGEQAGTDNSSDMYTITVDGEKKTLSLGELKKQAELGGGAYKRFQEAKELADSSRAMMERASKGLKVIEIFDSLNKGGNLNDDDITTLSGILGVDPQSLLAGGNTGDGIGDNMGDNMGDNTGDNMMGQYNNYDSGAPGGANMVNTNLQGVQKIGLENLTPELRSIIDQSKNAHIEATGNKMKAEVKNYVDNDTELGKILSNLNSSEDEQTKISSTLFDMVYEDVQRKILAGQPYGTEMIKTSVKQAGLRLKGLGIPSMSPKSSLGLGPGLAGGLPTEIQADEPIKRVSSTEGKWAENAVKRLQQSIFKARKAGNYGR